jgi:hypothetical protein
MTLICLNAASRRMKLPNLVGSPQFAYHWHQGSPELVEPFDAKALKQQKTQLVTATFGLRDASKPEDTLRQQRHYIHEQCLAAAPNCSFAEWKYEQNSHQAILHAMRTSWCDILHV